MKTPILDMLLKYKSSSPISFHVPGHRNGLAFSHLRSIYDEGKYTDYLVALQKVMELDVTELSITDDLHQPEGAIKEAQQLAASFYGANHSFFLVGGSTAGNIASILSVCEQGDTIIVQRNAHKSVINGCKLAGVNIVFIYPEVDELSGYATLPSYEIVEKAITNYPFAKAVFLTSPNYYGMSVSLKKYSDIIHKHNMIFIVDEAHGAHYGLHPNLPKSAMSYGADLVIQSTHKTLPSLTMSAMLHVNSNRVNIEIIQEQLALIESSSPSFILMAALDLARAIMEESGGELIEQSLQIRQRLIDDLKRLQFRIAVNEYSNSSDIDKGNKQAVYYDPLRLHVYDSKYQFSGEELQQQFEKYGIWVEMSSFDHCILVLHIGYIEEEYEQLLARLMIMNEHIKDIDLGRDSSLQHRLSTYYNSNRVDEPVLLTRQVSRKTKLIPFESAINERCGEMVVPYPPGIPLIYVGEVITKEKIEEIKAYIVHGSKIQANNEIYNGQIKIIVN